MGSQGRPRNHMAEEHSSESILVSKQTVQGVLGNLGKGFVGRRKHCEGSSAGKSVNQPGCFNCCKQGGELGCGNGKLGNVLGGGGWGNGKPRVSSSPHLVVVVAGGGCGDGEASEGDDGLHAWRVLVGCLLGCLVGWLLGWLLAWLEGW